MGNLIAENLVLKGLNFCGLKRESTAIPLRIMNNLLENAREKGNELWVTTQDISKAYNLVSLESLRTALSQIDISARLIDWIINLIN